MYHVECVMQLIYSVLKDMSGCIPEFAETKEDPELKDLIEGYRDFTSRSKPTTMEDMTARSRLLTKTTELFGPPPIEPEKIEPTLYRFQVDKDEAEKKEQ